MKHIVSRENPLFKRLRRLAQGKAEKKSAHAHTILLEGIHLCLAWIEHRGLPGLLVFDQQRLSQNKELQDLAARVPDQICITLDSLLAHQLSDVGHGQGVYALVQVQHTPLPQAIVDNCVWFDGIQDPGNVGTLLRTAAAAGVTDAYLGAGCASAWSPKVLRSGQGAHFALNIIEGVDLQALCPLLRIPLLATTLDQHAVSLYELALPERCAWVLGNEGQGVDPHLLARADYKVFIPQAPQVESLNVGVAAGICLFEQRRQALFRSAATP